MPEGIAGIEKNYEEMREIAKTMRKVDSARRRNNTSQSQ
jgi:hypothetical protein